MEKIIFSDEELMVQLKEGKKEALLELYNRHSGKVWTYLRKRAPTSVIEDLFQDVFVKLVEKKDGWTGQPFLLWFYVVLRNTVIDFYRDRKIETKYLQLFQDQIDIRDSDTQVEDLLALVPEDKAKLLREFFSEGRSYKELADKYDATEVSLRKRLSRAIQILKGSHRDER